MYIILIIEVCTLCNNNNNHFDADVGMCVYVCVSAPQAIRN